MNPIVKKILALTLTAIMALGAFASATLGAAACSGRTYLCPQCVPLCAKAAVSGKTARHTGLMVACGGAQRKNCSFKDLRNGDTSKAAAMPARTGNHARCAPMAPALKVSGAFTFFSSARLHTGPSGSRFSIPIFLQNLALVC